jgi:hypothetical protein
MRFKQLFPVATCAAAVLSLGAGTALAGEVTGPPGPGSVTPKPVNGHSICAYSGLNDYVNGPTDFHVQSFGQDVRLHGAVPQEFNPGSVGACRVGPPVS